MNRGIGVLLFASTITVFGRGAVAQTLLPTEFTYQGYIEIGGQPFTGVCDADFTVGPAGP